MKKNNNNNLIDNIDESNFNDSMNKESSSFNTTRDLSPNSINKPWYKKKGTIIGISSTLGAGILTTAIAVPLVLTSTQNTAELSKVITVYDSAKKTAKLIVEGKNLPKEQNLYSVFRETTTKALTEIKADTITLKFISATEINLDFKDDSITTGTTKPMYQVKLNNGTTSGSTIVSKPEETLPQPTFTITTQPSNVTLSPSNTNATFTVTPSTITNPITGANLSYQWKISDIESATDETKWTIIPNATSSSYTYDAKALAIGTKKYFKCTVSYKYANSITTTPVSVVRVTGPSINISTQTQNVNLVYSSANSTQTISVTANIVNGTAGTGLTYQWKTSDAENGEFNIISSATTSSYEITNITAGSKKYYKCTISYTGIPSVDSKPIFVAKAARPVVVITSNLPSTVNLTHTETSKTLRIAANVNNPVDGESLIYQWQEATTNSDASFTNIESANSTSYEVTNVAYGSTKYYRCKVSTTSAAPVTSTVANVTKVQQATFTITTQPAATTPLTSASTNFSLTVAATVVNSYQGQDPTYQWKSSTSQNGEYVNIDGATRATYTKELDANTKNSLRDTWYKCEVSYANAVTPTILSNPALVKMTLTAAEARLEFIKWSAIRTNYEPIIKEFFKGINTEGSSLHLYYTSLQDHTFKSGSEPKNVEVVSVEGLTLPVSGDVDGLKTYKIRLKTLGTSIYTSKTGSDTTTEKTLPTGSFIEFYTLFSFQGNNKILRNTSGSADYDMNLSLSFEETATAFTTTAQWLSTNADNGPSETNPLKKNAYPVKFYNTDESTVIFTDSLYLPMRPAATAFTTANTTPAIPAYHIRLNQ